MIEEGLHALILADTATQSLIAGRLYPVIWPDVPTFPLCTFQRASTSTQSVLSGPLSLQTCRVQYDAWSQRYSDVKALFAAIDNVLNGYAGTLPNGTRVVDITLDSSLDLYDSVALAHRVSSDYLVTFYTS